ncbi:MAG: uracil-DNA glycosylase [Arcobacteraceae bacterium]|nr:uracil-DNA glycosylase [Arcobacteraceae bacterium]MDY0328189.1 uracil-DNA glycosylase [Arcobacteraceae bacterium]
MIKTKSIKILKTLYYLKSFGYNYNENVVIQHEKKVVALPNSMSDLNQVVQNCNLCNLSKTRTNILFGNGASSSGIVLLTFAPTDLEDKEGRFYSGRAGQMIENIVTNVLKRNLEDVFITSVLKCKPSVGDSNLSDSIDKCTQYLNHQLKLIKPKIVIIFGENVYESFIGKSDFEEVKGNIFEFGGLKILATYEHTHILKNPTLKKEVLVSMLKVNEFMENCV